MKQKGFALLETLLITLILAVVSFGGYYVWHRHEAKTKVDSYAACAKQPKAIIQQSYPAVCRFGGKSFTESVKSGAAPNSTQSSSSAAQNYLTIKEWGVNLTFKDADKVTYELGDVVSDPIYGKSQNAELFLATAPGDCKDTGFGLAKSWQPSGTGVGEVHLGDYYYQVGGASGTCNDDPSGENGAFNKLRAAIVNELDNESSYTISNN